MNTGFMLYVLLVQLGGLAGYIVGSFVMLKELESPRHDPCAVCGSRRAVDHTGGDQ